ncbi:MAG: LysR family transcriptional regulator [Betaproteobacteria bacterium]|nr:LysR family transcriptional regulator [Betaproteobacteria bacterium]
MNNKNFNWSLIPSFLAALEHGSLMGAARATGVSQPTLGRHIAELEQQLNVVLFERTGRGLQATPNALALAEAAQTMQSGAAHFSRMATGSAAGLQGLVRLSASQPVACFLLPPILAHMRQALPDITVALVVSNDVSNLLRRDADIALRMVRPEQSSLIAKRIGHISIQACAHISYLQRQGTPQQAADLMGHDLIGGDHNSDIDMGFEAQGFAVKDLRFALRSDDLIAQWAAVKAGLGVGFMADYLLRVEPSVQAFLPALQLPKFPVWLTVHRELQTSARIRAVYDYLAAEVAKCLGAS